MSYFDCSCYRCLVQRQEEKWQIGDFLPTFPVDVMMTCTCCGSKRCPHATDHNLPCTGSNEPDQPGSRYTTPTPRDPE